MSAAASPASVSILRHLGALGHTVIGMDSGTEVEALGRKFCDLFYISPRADSPEYLDFLQERLKEMDLFLPFIDEELLAIAENWRRIPSELAKRIAISDPETVLDCGDKLRFQQACQAAKLPIAPSVDGAPAFFKPRYGRGGRGVIELHDERMFAAMRGRDGVFQRAITGEEFTVDAIFDRDGHLITTASRRRIRAAGVSTVGEVLYDEKLHNLAARLGKRWNFRFAVNFQVIRDSDNHDWIIELNPRLSGSGIFSALAGCDPFAATVALWKGEKWTSAPRRLRVWRYWQEITDEAPC